jgi:hypothetical protein
MSEALGYPRYGLAVLQKKGRAGVPQVVEGVTGKGKPRLTLAYREHLRKGSPVEVLASQVSAAFREDEALNRTPCSALSLPV